MQNGMTFSEVDHILKETTHTSYPVVISRDQPYIVGQIQRRDLQIVLSTSRVSPLRFENIAFQRYSTLGSQKMQRFRSSPCLIQFTSGLEASLYSDPESDNQPEQQLNSSSEVIRVANLLDQVILLVTNANPYNVFTHL